MRQLDVDISLCVLSYVRFSWGFQRVRSTPFGCF